MSSCTCHCCSVSWLLWWYTHSGSCGIPLSSMHVKDPGWFCVLWLLSLSLHLSHDQSASQQPNRSSSTNCLQPDCNSEAVVWLCHNTPSSFSQPSIYHSNSSWTVQIHAALTMITLLAGRKWEVWKVSTMQQSEWSPWFRRSMES